MPGIPAVTLWKVAVTAVLIAVLAGLFALRSCNTSRTASAEAHLATGQQGAAIESGRDAVQTLGNAQGGRAGRPCHREGGNRCDQPGTWR